MTLSDKHLIFVDLETSGLDPATSEIVELACVATDWTGQHVLGEYATKVIPTKAVPDEAARVNGYNELLWLAEGLPLEIAMGRMLGMGRDAVFVAHNADFDWGFIRVYLDARQMRWPGPRWRVCTMQSSWPLLWTGRIPNVQLATVADYFGVQQEAAHTALSDVHDCRAIYLRLMSLYSPALGKVA